MEQRLFTKTMNLHNKVSNLCWLTWVWVRKSVQNPGHFLVSLGNFSPQHMCSFPFIKKALRELWLFYSQDFPVSDWPSSLPPPGTTPPGTTISGRATGFPHLFSTVLTAFTDNTAGHGFPPLLHIKATFPGSRVISFHRQPYPNKMTKMVYTAKELEERSCPKVEGFKLPLFKPKILSIFHH